MQAPFNSDRDSRPDGTIEGDLDDWKEPGK